MTVSAQFDRCLGPFGGRPTGAGLVCGARGGGARGFTLIELLIVVAIIAILAAIAVPNFLEAQTRSKASRVAADFRAMGTALESYRVENNNYPPQGPANGQGGQDRLSLLTSPVAYMTVGRFRDPFQPEAMNGEAKEKYYTYRNFKDLIVQDPASYPAASLEHAWGLFSAGPDRASVGGKQLFSMASGSFNLAVVYDPTNGTRSAGDIYRTRKGPGAR